MYVLFVKVFKDPCTCSTTSITIYHLSEVSYRFTLYQHSPKLTRQIASLLTLMLFFIYLWFPGLLRITITIFGPKYRLLHGIHHFKYTHKRYKNSDVTIAPLVKLWLEPIPNAPMDSLMYRVVCKP